MYRVFLAILLCTIALSNEERSIFPEYLEKTVSLTGFLPEDELLMFFNIFIVGKTTNQVAIPIYGLFNDRPCRLVHMEQMPIENVTLSGHIHVTFSVNPLQEPYNVTGFPNEKVVHMWTNFNETQVTFVTERFEGKDLEETISKAVEGVKKLQHPDPTHRMYFRNMFGDEFSLDGFRKNQSYEIGVGLPGVNEKGLM